MVTFNGVDLSAYIKVKEIRRDILAPNELVTETIPVHRGSFFFRKRAAARMIEVDFVITDATSLADLRTKVRNLAKLIDVEEPASLVFSDEPDKIYHAIVDGDTAIDEVADVAQGTLKFLLPDPYAESATPKTVTIGVPDMVFSRSTSAYLGNGYYQANVPRYGTGRVGKGIIIEGWTQNLLTANQASVETDMTGLASYSAAAVAPIFARDTGNAYIGSASAMVQASGAGNLAITTLPTKVSVSPWYTYSFSAYTKTNAAGRTWQITAFWYDAAGVFLSSTVGVASNATTDWTRMTLVAMAPGSAASVYMEIMLNNAATNDVLWYDAGQMESGLKVTTWTPGGSERSGEMVTLDVASGDILGDHGQVDVWVYEDGVAALQYYWDSVAVGGGSAANRFMMCKDSDMKNYVWFNGASQLNTPTGSVGWHRWTAAWDGFGIYLYMDGVLKTSKTLGSSVTFTGIEKLSVGTRSSGTGALGGVIDDFRVSRIDRPAAVISGEQNAALVVDQDTVAKWGFENTLAGTCPVAVMNDGTAEAFPSSIKATLTEDTTFLFVTTPDKFVLLGNPVQTDTETQFAKEQRVLAESGSTTSGWTAATTDPDGQVITGNMISNGVSFKQDDFGTGTGWRGGSLIRSFSSPLSDFKAEVYISLKAGQPDQMGSVGVYLLDVNGVVVSKFGILDAWAATERNKAFWRLGSTSSGVQMWATEDPTAWNDFVGRLLIQREGNKWTALISKFDPNTNKHDFVWSKVWIDKDNLYSAQVASIQLRTAAYASNPQMDAQTIDQIFVAQITPTTTTQIPLIGRAGDVIEVDCETAVVRRNGEPFMTALAPESDFFPLKPGANTLAVRPAGAAVVQVTHKQRWL